MATHVLMINTVLSFTVSLKQALERTGAFSVHPFTTPDAAFEYLQTHAQDVALVDFGFTTMAGEEIVRRLRVIQPDISVVATPKQPDMIIRAFNLQGSLDTPYTARDVIPVLNRAAGARPTAQTRRVPPPRGTSELLPGHSGITGLFRTSSDKLPPLSTPSPQPEAPKVDEPSNLPPEPRDAQAGWPSSVPSSLVFDAPEDGDFSSADLDMDIPDWVTSPTEVAPDVEAMFAPDSHDEFMNSIRDDVAPPSGRSPSLTDFHLPGITDRDYGKSQLSQPFPPDTLPENQPFVGFDEPPTPSFEDSGTISDLMTGANDAGFRDVLAILRGDSVPSAGTGTAAPMTDNEMEEIFASFYADTDEEGNGFVHSRTETSPAYDPFRAFDTDDSDDEADGPTPAQVILATALADSLPPESFSLDSVMNNIEKQLPSHRPNVQPLPSWTKQGLSTFETEIDEPDFLPPEALPEPFMIADSSPSAAIANQTTLPAGGSLTEPAADFVTETWDESPSPPFDMPEMDQESDENGFDDSLDDGLFDEPDWLADWQGDELTSNDWSDVFNATADEAEADEADEAEPEAKPVSTGVKALAALDLAFFAADFESDEVAVEEPEELPATVPHVAPDAELAAVAATVPHEFAVEDSAEPEATIPHVFAVEDPAESDATVPHVIDTPDTSDTPVVPEMPAVAVLEPLPPLPPLPPLIALNAEAGYDSSLYDTDFDRMAAFDFPDAVILTLAPAPKVAGDELLPDPEKGRIAQLALSLTQVSLELTADAILLTHGEEIVAVAGELSEGDVLDLRNAVGNDWGVDGQQARIRFIRLESSSKEYMLYSIATVDDLTLSMMFAGTTPLRDIRRQSRRLTDALAAVPEPAGMTASAQAIRSLTHGMNPTEIEGPSAEPSALIRYSVVWLLRDAYTRISEDTARGLEAGLRTQLQGQGWRVERIEARDEYVSLLADLPSDRLAKDLIRDLKRRSAEIARTLDPSLNGDNLWADGYLMVMPGRALDSDEIQQFIAFERM